MNCKDVNKKLMSFLDGELDIREEDAIRIHLSDCSNCKSIFKTLSNTYGAIEFEKQSVTLDPFLAQKVWDKVHNHNASFEAPIIPIRRTTIVSIAAAGLALGIAIGTLLNTTTNEINSNSNEQGLTLLADDYFPSEFYSPYDELNNND